MNIFQDYAVASKVRALYGMRLAYDDYAHIANMRSVAEVAAYLRVRPSYESAMDTISSNDRASIQNALERSLLDEYFRILSFIKQDDLVIMRFLVVSMELKEIMRFMWLAESGRSSEYTFSMPKYFDYYSRINYRRLSDASTYDEMLEAVRETQYYKLLSQLELRPSGWPDYTMVEVAIRRSYYRWVMSVIDAKYRGSRRDTLRDAVGFEVDMINIMAIFRVRRNFSAATSDITRYLLPISYKLKPSVIKRLIAAPDEAGMLEVLRNSGYRRVFSERLYDSVDSYYYTGMISFYRRQLRAGEPYVGTPMAYLFLKQLEIRNISTLIECVQYGISPEKAMSYLHVV